MREALHDELHALNAIYGDGTVVRHDEDEEKEDEDEEDGAGSEGYILRLPPPRYILHIRLRIPAQYPDTRPTIVHAHADAHVPSALGPSTDGGGGGGGGGDGSTSAVARYQAVLDAVFQPGHVCLFDLIQELSSSSSAVPPPPATDDALLAPASVLTAQAQAHEDEEATLPPPPAWILSDARRVKKSVFVGRCVRAHSLAQVRAAIEHLRATDKRAARATHNITAWRIVADDDGVKAEADEEGAHDDGEKAAGGRVLHLMRVMAVRNVLVVVSRWYGGVPLGADRFRLINEVAREALVRAGAVLVASSSSLPPVVAEHSGPPAARWKQSAVVQKKKKEKKRTVTR
ncbi:MAG: eIF2 kinase Gcn2p negative regulator [Phylliscum demangeonii]|nr:MAG: eIF2 kinase Gcn2p negative regulator [Phylliscum demangeonii]